MTEFPPSKDWLGKAKINPELYEKMYQDSLANPDAFWREQAKRLHWYKPFSKVKNTSFHAPVDIRWFQDGQLNVCYNCVDRHLPQYAAKTALIWEGDDPQTNPKHITYQELYENVCKMANVLLHLGVKRKDVVTIYMPMIPEAIYAMLACARIGAIHSVIFGGFSADSLVDRILDCDSRVVVTADFGRRGGKLIPLKDTVDKALLKTPDVNSVLVIENVGKANAQIQWNLKKDFWYHDLAKAVASDCPPVAMDAEDPLFILYTSGSTGKPKGVLHTTGGYLVYAAMTHEYVFDYHDEDIYWCTADVGWVTGHSYIVYGPLANAATTVVFEGVPTYPTASRFWEVIDRHKINIFYTAPTAIRSLMREGDDWVKKTKRSSLRLLGSVGEPINPEAWLWYHKVVGDGRCPIVDTWWQTETGGILISPLPGATTLRPGSATKPLFGIQPVLMDEKGQPILGAGKGVLCLADSWPGQMRTVFRAHDRFVETYFKAYPGYYFTGDGCNRDEEGNYWITGRVDDVINVAGHRLGTAEIESALVSHTSVSEAAVVGCHHDIKGQGIYAFVTLKTGVTATEELKKELIQWVRNEISPIASPDHLQWAPALPKTRSGKIMRRILRKIATKETESIGDVTTLADPSVVTDLIKGALI